MAKTQTMVDVEPLSRLEEKVRLLVKMLERLRSEQERSAAENARLSRDLETARARVSELENSSAAEMSLFREEREVIRTRVAEMLDQLEALDL